MMICGGIGAEQNKAKTRQGNESSVNNKESNYSTVPPTEKRKVLRDGERC